MKLFAVHMPKAVDAPLLEVLHSGYITQGQRVEDFEQKLSRFVGSQHVVSVNSGTSALTLALRLAGVSPGDEVITTPMTCTATNLPILSLGGVPVFADVDKDGLLDPKSVIGRLTEKTKAIMAVHWGGTPADVASLCEIAQERGIKLIVDAAHALGGFYPGGYPVGALADFTCFSLQAIKHITTGDGGALVCKDVGDFKRAKALRWFGIDRDAPTTDTRIDQDIEEWGYKFHMNDLNATIGIVQLDFLEQIVLAHRENAKRYDRELSDYFQKPTPSLGSYWLYTILLPTEAERDLFKEFMSSVGIQVSQVHKRNDHYAVFKKYDNGGLVGVDDFASRMVCLPVHWALSPSEVDTIIQSCNEFAGRNI